MILFKTMDQLLNI